MTVKKFVAAVIAGAADDPPSRPEVITVHAAEGYLAKVDGLGRGARTPRAGAVMSGDDRDLLARRILDAR